MYHGLLKFALNIMLYRHKFMTTLVASRSEGSGSLDDLGEYSIVMCDVEYYSTQYHRDRACSTETRSNSRANDTKTSNTIYYVCLFVCVFVQLC